MANQQTTAKLSINTNTTLTTHESDQIKNPSKRNQHQNNNKENAEYQLRKKYSIKILLQHFLSTKLQTSLQPNLSLQSIVLSNQPSNATHILKYSK